MSADHTKLHEVRDQTLTEQAVTLDGMSFLNCRLIRCHVTFYGGLFNLADTILETCTWRFEGGAARTLTLLREFHLSDPNFVGLILDSVASSDPNIPGRIIH